MAFTSTDIDIATTGTRKEVITISASLVVTAGADTTTTTPVVFDKAFVAAPQIIGVVCTNDAVLKGNIAATDITTTGMNVKIYQVLAGDIASATYQVQVTLIGWKVS